jgi:hypothetical protein
MTVETNEVAQLFEVVDGAYVCPRHGEFDPVFGCIACSKPNTDLKRRYYVRQHIYAACGHPEVCTMKVEGADAFCGWCADVAAAQSGR